MRYIVAHKRGRSQHKPTQKNETQEQIDNSTARNSYLSDARQKTRSDATANREGFSSSVPLPPYPRTRSTQSPSTPPSNPTPPEPPTPSPPHINSPAPPPPLSPPPSVPAQTASLNFILAAKIRFGGHSAKGVDPCTTAKTLPYYFQVVLFPLNHRHSGKKGGRTPTYIANQNKANFWWYPPSTRYGPASEAHQYRQGSCRAHVVRTHHSFQPL